MNCRHFLRTKHKLESHNKVCENIAIWIARIRLSQYCDGIWCHQIIRAFIITIYYFSRPWMFNRTDWWMLKQPNDLSATKRVEHIPSSFSMYTILSSKSTENKHHVYRNKDWVKNFCKSLREHAVKIISFRIKEKNLLAKEQQKWYENDKIC